MPKKRQSVPRSTRDEVLKEYNHRCAICGNNNPHLHHIDEDPSNNDPLNLIPLCPNCHLGGQHNPLQALEPERLRLYRIYKHPYILKPQFFPLFSRMQFLSRIDQKDASELRQNVRELLELVEAHEKGSFYVRRLEELIRQPIHPRVLGIWGHESEIRDRQLDIKIEAEYKEQLRTAKDQVIQLITEMLPYQSWDSSGEKH